jgi:hypothetical protein
MTGNDSVEPQEGVNPTEIVYPLRVRNERCDNVIYRQHLQRFSC